MTRWVSVLVVANVAAFLLQGSVAEITGTFMWHPATGIYRPWTAVTYMFLHGSWGHLLFNMLGLYMFGPAVESRIGGGRFLGLYLASGLGGALACYLTPMTAVIGASGAVFGVSLAYARYWPEQTMMVFFFPMTARMMVISYAVVSVFSQLTGAQQGISHLGHLGGFAGGWLFCVAIERLTGSRDFRRRAETGWTVERRGAAPVPKVIVELATGEKETLERWARIPVDQLHPVNREEHDRIREKITASGVRSLTALEREFMERFAGLAG
jgi:membrane associated rhomboid family serine protease